MNPSINASQHITTLRQTHRTATSLLPVLTAGLTVAGAVLAAMEARSSRAESETSGAGADAFTGQPHGSEVGSQSGPLTAMQARGRRLTVRRYIATLLGRTLLVALGIALVLTLVYVASASGRTGQAVLLTALVLLVFYLTEKVARRACACN